MVQKRFGSAKTTGRKLDVIGEYLAMYQKALSNKGFQTVYIDGFAGSGEVPIGEHKSGLFDEDVQTVIAGSVDRALEIKPPFTRYIFIDNRKKCIRALKSKFKDHLNADRLEYFVGDANERIQNICRDVYCKCIPVCHDFVRDQGNESPGPVIRYLYWYAQQYWQLAPGGGKWPCH